MRQFRHSPQKFEFKSNFTHSFTPAPGWALPIAALDRRPPHTAAWLLLGLVLSSWEYLFLVLQSKTYSRTPVSRKSRGPQGSPVKWSLSTCHNACTPLPKAWEGFGNEKLNLFILKFLGLKKSLAHSKLSSKKMLRKVNGYENQADKKS